MAVLSGLIIGAAAVGAAMSASSKNKALDRASKDAKKGIYSGGDINAPGGITAGTEFGKDGRASIKTGLGSFQESFDSLQGKSGDFFGGNQGGAQDNLESLATVGLDSMGRLDAAGQSTEAFSGLGDFNTLGAQANTDFAFGNQDPFALGSSIADKFRPGLERAQGTMRNNTFDKLFQTGKGANSQAASPILEGLQQQFSEQNTALDQFGLDQGNQMRNDAFSRAFGAVGQRDALGKTNLTTAEMLSNNANSRFGVSSSMFDSFLRNQEQQQGLGMSSIGGAADLSQLPLSFLAAMQSAGALRSDSTLGAAGIRAKNAAGRANPFSDAISAGAGAYGGLGG